MFLPNCKFGTPDDDRFSIYAFLPDISIRFNKNVGKTGQEHG
ncbi:Uncharacterized protein dnm_032170 [Desulfonema magnum]|uniref:Uncharacterized protein n=1 Tax=Desulfonema magnum TaxID=45655 RepID=A0A975BKE9_9BACT|nr:Uncharacterized protein dnm_032170 [Desulfonema magnum]